MSVDLSALKITKGADVQYYGDNKRRVWNLEESAHQKPGAGKPSELQNEYSRIISSEYEKALTEKRKLKGPNATLSDKEISALRGPAGEIYINKKRQDPSHLRSYVRSINPETGLGDPAKIKIAEARQKVDKTKIDPETPTGIWSSNPSIKADQQRRFAGLGLIPDGMGGEQFAVGSIIRDARKRERYELMPKGKSLQGFIEEMIGGWNYSKRITEKGEHAGHIKGAKSDPVFIKGGSMDREQVVRQPGLPTDPTGKITTKDGVDLRANVPLGSKTAKGSGNPLGPGFDDLRHAGFQGFTIEESWANYLKRKGPLPEYTAEQEWLRARHAHEEGIGAEESFLKHEKRGAVATQRMEEQIGSFAAPKNDADNPTIPKSSEIAAIETKYKSPKAQSRNLMNLVKGTLKGDKASTGVFRGLAHAAGMANNPLVNLAGDIVGASIDGVAVFADPSSENVVDFALSSGQVVLTTAGFIVAAIPVPGARPGAFAIMKVGDAIGAAHKAGKIAKNLEKWNRNLAQIERIWGMGREGRNIKKMGAVVQQPDPANVTTTGKEIIPQNKIPSTSKFNSYKK
jgi:hypothetical protein|tara:strand:- start:502 stop:2214 length:1713 start_codon:yes stop_codon:yes gene_type:complete